MNEDPLAPIDWPEGDPYRDPLVYRAHERFWWHQRIATDLRAAADHGHPSNCVAGIAGNTKLAPGDVTKYVRMMITWGELVRVSAPADNDFAPDTWVALAPAERYAGLEYQGPRP